MVVYMAATINDFTIRYVYQGHDTYRIQTTLIVFVLTRCVSVLLYITICVRHYKLHVTHKLGVTSSNCGI